MPVQMRVVRAIQIGVLLEYHQEGLAAVLQLEARPGGIGVLVADPVTMMPDPLVLSGDPAFTESVRVATQLNQHLFAGDIDVFWRLRLLPHNPVAALPPLTGGSAGAAFAVGLRHLLDPRLPDIDAGWAVIGAVTPAGTIGSVDGYPSKLRAASRHQFKVLIPSCDLDRIDANQARLLPALHGVVAVEDISRRIGGWRPRPALGEPARTRDSRSRLLGAYADLAYHGNPAELTLTRRHLRDLRRTIEQAYRMSVDDATHLALADILTGWTFTEVGRTPPQAGRELFQRARQLTGTSVEMGTIAMYAQWAEACHWRKQGDMGTRVRFQSHLATAEVLLQDLAYRSGTDASIRSLALAELAKIAIEKGDASTFAETSANALSLSPSQQDSLIRSDPAWLPVWDDQADSVAYEVLLRGYVNFGGTIREMQQVLDRAVASANLVDPARIGMELALAQGKLRAADSRHDGLWQWWRVRCGAVELSGYPRLAHRAD